MLRSRILCRIPLLCLTWLMVVAFVIPVMAVDPSKSVKEYVPKLLTVADGLPQPWVQAITQTPDGYMWFGTQEGIARFNGVKFHTFDQNGTPGINHNNIRSLLYDQVDGSLWIGTYGGGLSRYQAGKFRAYTIDDGLPGNFILTLAQRPTGELWIGTDKGLAVFSNEKISAVGAKDEALKHPISGLTASPDGSIWFLIKDTIYRADKLGRISPVDWHIPEPRTIYADRQGHVWVGSMTQGLYAWSGDKVTHYGNQSSVPKTPVRSIYQDRAGSIWVAFYGAGLCRLQPDATFDCYLSKDGLAENSLVSIYEDREGNLWLGTEANGIIRLRDTNFVIYDKRMGLFENYVLGIHQSKDGAIWIGTRPGLNRMKDGKITSIRISNSLPGNTVAVVEDGEQGDLWVGTEEGLKLLRNETVIKTFTVRDGLASNTIHAMLRDRHGYLWIGDRMGGLTRYKEGRFTRFTQKDGLISVRVRNIFEDHEGGIWFSTEEGLTRFKDDKFTNFALERGPGGATGGAVCIYEDARHVFWIGTYGSGLVRYEDGKFASFKRKDGLFDDSIWSIVEDDSGNLWMSSNRGLFRASKSNLNDFAAGATKTISSISYGTVDGLLTTDFNGGEQSTGWKTREGKLLFATSIGLVEVDPLHLRLNKLPPPVSIEDVLVDKRSTSDHQVPVGRGELEVQFAGLSFVAPEKVVFRYKLEGFDKDWNFSGGRRVAFYTNIPPGPYQFRVQAANDDGIWNDTGAAFDLYLKPHFYQTGWFILLCICGGILIVAGIYRLRVSRLHNRQQQLVGLVDERTKELQEEITHRKETEKQLQEQIVERDRATENAEAATRAKGEFLANMSHEIRTPLNGVMATLELASQTQLNDEQKELLQMSRDSADALLVVLNDILDFSKIEAGRLKFEEMEFSLADALEDAARTMAVRAHQKKLELSCQVAPGVPDQVVGDSGRLKQVLMNLLGNAVKFTEKGEVTLRVETEEQSNEQVTLRFSVADTGIGIPKEKQSAIFEAFSQADSSVSRRFGGTGLGLAICARIVDLFGGHLWVESEPGKGSVFFFTATFQVGEMVAKGSHFRKAECLRGRKVLVVDDNRTALGIIEQMLRGFGLKVTTATSGAEGLAALKRAFVQEEPFDLLLSDCDMPGMNGFAFVQEACNQGNLVVGALMMLTADNFIASVERCKRIGAGAHVIKPVKQAELLAALTGLIQPALKQMGVASGSITSPEAIHLRILLAEDNSVNQKLAVKLLEKWGHEVAVANNGKLAIDYLRNNNVDLIFMDVHMPEMDGYAATRAIRAWEKTRGMGEHVPIIAMTASAMAGDREKCLQAGMDGYVSKPISQKELAKAIQQSCELLHGAPLVEPGANMAASIGK